MKEIDFQFKEKLNHYLGGFSYNYCYQCGACASDCPTHRFNRDFSPQSIMLQTIYGLEEELTGPDSLIWNCTNCYNCYERCPQDVHPIEVIIALKNLARAKGTSPKEVDGIIDRVKANGFTVSTTDLIRRRRSELGLPEFKMNCHDDVASILSKK